MQNVILQICRCYWQDLQEDLKQNNSVFQPLIHETTLVLNCHIVKIHNDVRFLAEQYKHIDKIVQAFDQR